MIDQLRSLAVFAHVAELGSFRAAARRLSLAPSVVSHHVGELERRLSLPLLYRTTRRVALTPEGAKLFSAAREMLDAAERGLDEATGRSASPSGIMRLTAPAFLAETALSRDLAAFCAAHPKVHLTASFSDAPQDLLRDGHDLALRIGRLQDSTHRARKLAEMRRMLVASPGCLEQHRVRSPRDLGQFEFVHLSSRPAVLRLWSRRGRKPAIVPFTPRVSVDSAAAVRELVIAGTGLATLPELIVRADVAAGRLVEVLPSWQAETVSVWAVWPGNAHRAGLTERFIEFMAPRISRLFS